MDEPYRSDPVVTLAPTKKHCYACASILDIRAELCPRCGIRQPPIPGVTAPETAIAIREPKAIARSKRDRIAAALFSLLLGWCGAQKLYVGNLSAGVLCMLFFWTGIPLIIGVIEGVSYLAMSDEDFAHKHPG
jgi:TM2 domain-containing membrane protein YozV